MQSSDILEYNMQTTDHLTSLYGSAAPTIQAAIYWINTGALPDDFCYGDGWEIDDTDDLAVLVAHAGEYTIGQAVWEAGGSRTKGREDLTSDEKERMIEVILQTNED